MAADFSAILQEATFNDELMDLSMPRIPPPAALDGLVRPRAIDPRHSELTQDGVMPSPSPKLSKRKKSMKKQPRKKTIQLNERFSSFAEFETTFENWKNENYHPFRTASSETLREPDGSIDPIFKYRYIVFHCAHYGTPRVRASGTRKNKNSYLPCGCKAMLRVNYNFNDRELFIASLNAEHNGHELSFDDYERVMRRKTRTRIADTDVAVPSPPSMVLAAPMGGDFGGHYAVGGYGGHQLTPNFAQVMAPKSFAQVLEQHKAMMGLPTPDIPNDYEPQQDKMTSFAAKVEVDDPDYRMRVRSGSVHSDTPSFNSDDLTGQRSAAATPAAIGLQQAQQHTGNDPALAPVPMSLADNPQIQMLIGTLLGQLNGLDANAVQTRLSALTTLLSALPHAQ